MFESTKNIYAIGRNYVKHIEELGNERPNEPVIFEKSLSSLTTVSELVFPKILGPIHHELELVLRVGRAVPLGCFVDLGCVSHIGLGLDFTARELQARLKAKGLPWFRAKNFANACFVGPMKEKDSFEDALGFQLYRNGILQQSGQSDHMIFSFGAILSFINQTIPLDVGDLIFTGTPSGVGSVASGDTLRIIAEQLDIDLSVKIH